MQSYQFENSTPNSGAAASAWFSRPISPLLAQTSVRTASKSGSLRTLRDTQRWIILLRRPSFVCPRTLSAFTPFCCLFSPFTFSSPLLWSPATLRFLLHSEAPSQKSWRDVSFRSVLQNKSPHRTQWLCATTAAPPIQDSRFPCCLSDSTPEVSTNKTLIKYIPIHT